MFCVPHFCYSKHKVPHVRKEYENKSGNFSVEKLTILLSCNGEFVRCRLVWGTSVGCGLHILKNWAEFFKFVFCNPRQSSPSLTILVPLWIIVISLVFFRLSNLLFLVSFNLKAILYMAKITQNNGFLSLTPATKGRQRRRMHCLMSTKLKIRPHNFPISHLSLCKI